MFNFLHSHPPFQSYRLKTDLYTTRKCINIPWKNRSNYTIPEGLFNSVRISNVLCVPYFKLNLISDLHFSLKNILPFWDSIAAINHQQPDRWKALLLKFSPLSAPYYSPFLSSAIAGLAESSHHVLALFKILSVWVNNCLLFLVYYVVNLTGITTR
jgi:hypothetical protein